MIAEGRTIDLVKYNPQNPATLKAAIKEAASFFSGKNQTLERDKFLQILSKVLRRSRKSWYRRILKWVRRATFSRQGEGASD